MSDLQFVMFSWWAAVVFVVICVLAKALWLALLDRIDTWRMQRAREHRIHKLRPLSNGRKPR